MNLLSLDSGIFVNTLTYLSGVEIAKLRFISKKVKLFIDQSSCFIYEVRMSIEYNEDLLKYRKVFPFRNDWKNIYVICDQYEVAKMRAPIHKQIIESRKNFLVFEKIAIMFEMAFSIISGAVNILKVINVGWAATRGLITAFLRENPGKTVQDAMIALGLTPKFTTLIDVNYQ